MNVNDLKDINQCDGCRRGLPLQGGIHRNPNGSYDHIGCTRHLYGFPKGDTTVLLVTPEKGLWSGDALKVIEGRRK